MGLVAETMIKAGFCLLVFYWVSRNYHYSYFHHNV